MFLFKFQKPDDEEAEILNHEEDFSLPQDYFVKEEWNRQFWSTSSL